MRRVVLRADGVREQRREKRRDANVGSLDEPTGDGMVQPVISCSQHGFLRPAVRVRIADHPPKMWLRRLWVGR